MANKIKYGLKNVYYAIATIGSDGTATYAMPVAFPGAVSLSMEPQGEATPFYADNIVYYMGNANNGYEGDFEVALVHDSFLKNVLGMAEDNKGVLYEDASAEAVHFALLFQFEGDEKATRHVLYNCVATRPAASSTTKGESVEPQTETLTITATTIYVSAIAKDIPKAKTTASTDTTVYNNWFSAVYQPAASSTPVVTT